MKRVLILFYGVICYSAFLAAFGYLIGFVADYAVPTSVDHGSPAATGIAHWIGNAILIALFGVQHAIMARRGFKAGLTQIIPAAAERSTFVLATCTVLGLIFWLWRPIPTVVWSVDHPILVAGLYGLMGLGFATVFVSSLLIDHFELFGLRQSWQGFRGHEVSRPQFVERGLYRWVRHPLMAGMLIAFWATPHMTTGHLLFATLFTGYIFVGVALEERDLVREHTSDYASYRARTAMLIPLRSRRT